jgi:AcrR family transcriptional regulator
VMSAMNDVAPSRHARRRRSDAERSIAAILAAAERVLPVRPAASMDEIAREAGTSRQTVYAHFPSRDAIVRVLFDRALEHTAAAMASAELDSGPAPAALRRFVEATWEVLQERPSLLVLQHPDWTPQTDEALHRPISEPLERVLARGQAAGQIDATRSTRWLVRAVLALGHLAAQEQGQGAMTPVEARDAWAESAERLTRVSR